MHGGGQEEKVDLHDEDEQVVVVDDKIERRRL